MLTDQTAINITKYGLKKKCDQVINLDTNNHLNENKTLHLCVARLEGNKYHEVSFYTSNL